MASIVLTISIPDMSGSPRMALAYAIALRDGGHEVTLLYAPIVPDRSILGSFSAAGFKIKESRGLKYPIGFASAKAVAGDLIALGADISISCQVREASIVARASRLAKIPNIHFAQNRRNFGGNFAISRLKRSIYKRSLKRGCSHLIAASKFVREQHVNEFDFPRLSTTVVDNGIDIKRIQQKSRNGETARNLIPDADGKFVIMQVGRITPQKGQDTLIKAFIDFTMQNDANLAGEKFLLVLVGAPGPSKADTAYFEKIEAIVEQSGLKNSVRMIGWVDQAADILPAADLIVHPANWEGGCPPLSVQEAMALAVPVAFSDCAGAPTDFRNGTHGMCFESSSVAACSNALRYLTDLSRSDLNSIGRSGQGFASIAFDVNKNAGRFVEIVNATLGNSDRS